MLVQLLNEGKMAHKWKAAKYKGIRYREHTTRKHCRQPDRYFNVRFRVAGISVNEGYGWASEGMSASKAALLVAELKKELRTGQGTGRLSDKRKAKQVEIEKKKQKEIAQERRAMTYEQFFCELYFPSVQEKKPTTLAREESLHKLWILPVIGTTPILNIQELDILKVKRVMEKKELAPRSIQYAFTCIQMVISDAIRSGYFTGANPLRSLPKKSKPKFDNRKTRFLSHEDADRLLAALATKSQQVHDMTLLSLHCGLRFGEIAALNWGDIDQTHGYITLRDTKSGKDRTVTMTGEVADMFQGRSGGYGDLVFPSRTGKPLRLMSRTFARTVEELGFNDGINDNDRKQRITFHSCRHTCASWLVMVGVPLYTVQKILGHSTIAMTERYAHLAPKEFKMAANLMEQGIAESRAKRDRNDGKKQAELINIY